MTPLKQADTLFSKYIRARDGRCLLERQGGCKGNLQCCHVISRRYHGTRFDPENARAMCLAHHKWETEHPLEGQIMWQNKLGRPLYDSLRRRALLHRGKLDFKAIIADLRLKLEELEAA